MFLRKKIFALDISDNSIKILLLKKSWKHFKIVSFGKLIIKPGLFENGKIIDRKKLAGRIKSLIKDADFGSIKTKKVIVNLPESRAFTHIFELPANLKKDQIKNVLLNEAEALIPYNADNIYWDYKIIKQENDKTPKKIKVFYVAAEKNIIINYYQLLKLCGLEPLALDLESIALARALFRKIEEPTLLIDIGARATGFNIFDQVGNRFSSSVGVAGNDFTKMLSGKLNVSWQEAENKKKKIGLDMQKDGGKIMQILQSVFPPITKEIRKLLKFYKDKYGQEIKKIVLTGGSSLMPQLDFYLAENIGIKVIVGKPWLLDYLEKSKKFNKAKAVMWSVPFGLALRGLERNPKEVDVNLLPSKSQLEISPELRKEISKENFIKIIRWSIISFIGLIIAFAIFGLIYWWEKIPLEYFKNLGEKAAELPVPKKINFNFTYDVMVNETKSNIEPNGIIYSTEIEDEKTYKILTGNIINKQATGKATIINNSKFNQPLVATTRLLSKEGVLFRLKNGVNVPAGGSIEVEIYADQPGPDGEIGSTTFTIPGLSGAKQKLIYAQSSEPTKGGTEISGVITADDLANAQADLESELISKALEDLKRETVKENEHLLSDIVKKEILKKEYSHKIGDRAAEFNLKMKMKIYGLVVYEDLVRNWAKKQLELQTYIPAGKKPDDYKITSLNYELQRYDLDAGTAVLNVRAVAELVD